MAAVSTICFTAEFASSKERLVLASTCNTPGSALSVMRSCLSVSECLVERDPVWISSSALLARRQDKGAGIRMRKFRHTFCDYRTIDFPRCSHPILDLLIVPGFGCTDEFCIGCNGENTGRLLVSRYKIHLIFLQF